jgi:hypothetical protein
VTCENRAVPHLDSVVKCNRELDLNPQDLAMQENGADLPEFTDEQLRAALKRVGRDALQAAFAAGRHVMILRDGFVVALYPDGSERVIAPLRPMTDGKVESKEAGRSEGQSGPGG